MILRTFAILLCLTTGSYSLNCTNERAGLCYCSQTHQNAKYELHCPSYTPVDQKINMKLEPGKFITMTCSPRATMLEIMPSIEGLDIGDVKIIKILNCPVPADPLAILFNKMGIMNLTKIEMLEFSQAQRPRGATEFQGYHFKNLSNLRVLELPRNGIKKIDKTFFTEVTKLTSLDLTSNRGIAIDGNSFQNLGELDDFTCHTCDIQSFEVDTFKGLVNLKKLSLHDNKLTSLPSGLFDNQKELSTLNLAKNQLNELPPRIFDKMENLTDIILSYNQFKTFPDNLFQMNKKLKSFTMLVNGNCLPFMGCAEDQMQKLVLPETMFHESSIEEIKMLWVPITNIPMTLFKGCRNLVNLTIQNSFITELPEEMFSDTEKIKLIDFSGNNIESLPPRIFRNLDKLESLRFIKNKLTKLDRNQFVDLRNLKIVHFPENMLSELPYEIFAPTKKLVELDLSSNKIELNPNKRFFTGASTFDKLRTFNIANNKLTSIPEEFTFTMLKLQVLNMSYNLIGQDRGVLEPDDINFIQRLDLLVDLSFNKIGRVSLYEDKLWNNRNHTFVPFKLNLTGNPIICDCIATELKQKIEGNLEGIFRDMFELTSKDLRCAGKSSEETKGLLLSEVKTLTCPFPSPSMEVNCTDSCSCSLNRELRETIIDCSNKSMATFPMDLVLVPKHSDTIRLHMENNLIQNLSRAVDRYYKTSNNNYKYITHLYLSNNNIDSFHQECLPPDLKELFLDNNRIETFKQTDINYFDSLVNRTKLELKLGNNLYECNCESRALYHFVKNRGSKIRDLDQVQLQCEDSKPIDLWKAKLDEFCWTTPPAAIIAAVAIVVIFLLGICFVLAIYTCYRETIVIWIYSKSWARIFFVEDVIDREKPYDAFLSYSHQDADFVEKTLLAGLESPDNPDHKYKCLIHTRDWNVGEMIPDQIIHSVESSRRTIIILSKSYIESMWTKLEFRAAHTQALQDKTQRVIIVVRGELPTKENMEEDLQKYLNLNTYLDSEDPWFWQKLRYALPHRGNQWSKKRTRRETDKMELMRSQAELELGKQSRTPSPKTLDVKNLLPNMESLGNRNVNVSNGQVKPSNGFNGYANGHMNGHANGHVNGHANGHANGQTHSVTEGGKAVSKIFPGR
eukprot:TRINITY_DN8224_c0_g1_i1.p1 TRINITY_DN8224_c0_g1~~TRINITY_DN8224_c0_g1_i1.p1  ORF type:complete len:1130 (+),score=224.17 TRINITY_DN8224_c0_g1_i1:40-3429(+)